MILPKMKATFESRKKVCKKQKKEFFEHIRPPARKGIKSAPRIWGSNGVTGDSGGRKVENAVPVATNRPFP